MKTHSNTSVPSTTEANGWLRDRGYNNGLLNTLAIHICLALAACQSSPTPQSTDPALILLSSVATEVNGITRQVSEIQQDNQPQFREPVVRDPRLLSKVNVVDYVGSPANLLQELASRIGYSYVELGAYSAQYSHRATPFAIAIAIRAKQQTVLNIVRDVAAQVGKGIVVSVSEQQQQIRLEYL